MLGAVVTDEKRLSIAGTHVIDDEVKDIKEAEIANASDSDVETYIAKHSENGTFVPDDNDEVIDPRLKNYPIPLVAKTVDLHDDPNEPILTFRYWTLSTFWVVVGCGVSSFYYFKPYSITLTSYAVQLLSWGMGSLMATYLPQREFSIFGRKYSLNPGPWNAKEHALIVVSYWGSCYTAYGLGPLSALEMWYGKKVNAGWGILFLLTTQMIGYGFTGLYRDILVRPPKIYYPGVLPNVALFNAMHRNPSVTKASLKFFSIVAVVTFCWEWIPQLIFPLLSSLPLLCYFGHGNPIAWVLGSGYYGFGLLNISLDWNYITFFQPMYTPLWSNASQIVGAIAACWLIYPIMYFTNTLNAKTFAPMSSSTFTSDGGAYNVTRILTKDFHLDQAAMDAYSTPHFSSSYAMYFFWGFAASTGALMYAGLFYGRDAWTAVKEAWAGRTQEYEDDPYYQLMAKHPRVPHWWYLLLLAVCTALSLGTIYGGGFELPWWGFFVICIVSAIMTFPNGILWGIANMQVGMAFLSEILSGAMFPGRPLAVLTALVYGRQILEQNLNLTSDLRVWVYLLTMPHFGFYMKIPEKPMFIGQIYGTLLGPFINYGMMRLIIDNVGKDVLTGATKSTAWLALKSRNYYSISVVWGVLGPKVFFSKTSDYAYVYYGFLVGPVAVLAVWLVHKWRPHWQLEERCNPVVVFYGATLFPVYQTANLMTSAIFAFVFMGYALRYRPAWFRKYNYLLGVGLDCGTQLMQTVQVFGINLPNVAMPFWWGNNAIAVDRCFPPASLPPGAQP